MSVAQEQRSERVEATERHGIAPPVWWLVFRREFIDLWTGGRVLLLLILFSLVMSVTSALRELESGLSLIPPVEMAFLTILSGISFGLFVGMVIGADSISGERERATLEPLLLTPAKPRQIVFGKFLAPVAIVVDVTLQLCGVDREEVEVLALEHLRQFVVGQAVRFVGGGFPFAVVLTHPVASVTAVATWL